MEEEFKKMSEQDRLAYVSSLTGVAGMKGMVKDGTVMTGHVIPKFLQMMYGWPELKRLALCIRVMPHDWKGHRHMRNHTAWYTLDGTVMSDDKESAWSDGNFITIPQDKMADAERMCMYLTNNLVEGHFAIDDHRHIKFRMCVRLTGVRDDDIGEFGGACETMDDMLIPWVPFIILACTDGVETAKLRHMNNRKLMKLDGIEDVDKFMHAIKEMTPVEMSQLPISALRFLEGLVKIMNLPNCVEALKTVQNMRDAGAGMSTQGVAQAEASNEEVLDGHMPERLKRKPAAKEPGDDLPDLDEQFT